MIDRLPPSSSMLPRPPDVVDFPAAARPRAHRRGGFPSQPWGASNAGSISDDPPGPCPGPRRPRRGRRSARARFEDETRGRPGRQPEATARPAGPTPRREGHGRGGRREGPGRTLDRPGWSGLGRGALAGREGERRPGHPHRPLGPARPARGRACVAQGARGRRVGVQRPVTPRGRPPSGGLRARPRPTSSSSRRAWRPAAPSTLQLRYDDGTTAELYFQGRDRRPEPPHAGGRAPGPVGGPGPAGLDGAGDRRRPRRPPGRPARPDEPLPQGRGPIDHPRTAPPARPGSSALNPEGHANAELVRRTDDPSRADFYFQPTADLSGKTLRMTVEYANGKIDRASVVGGRIDPGWPCRVARCRSSSRTRSRAAGWARTGGRDSKRGDVHVSLAGLPAERTVVAASLSDSAWGHWAYRAEGRPKSEALASALPLDFRRARDRTRADLVLRPRPRRVEGDDGPLPDLQGWRDGGRRLPRRPMRPRVEGRRDRPDVGGREARRRPASPRESVRHRPAREGDVSARPPPGPRPPRHDHRRARGDLDVLAGAGRAPLDGGDQDPPQPHDPRRVRRPVRRPDPLEGRRQLRPRRHRRDRQLRQEPARPEGRPRPDRPRHRGPPGRRPGPMERRPCA